MYQSTRNNKVVSASIAIIDGLSSEGGLYVLKDIPKINLEEYLNLNYKEICFKIFKLFLNDFTDEEINYVINSAYNDFDIDSLVDFQYENNYAYLELYHGPTKAFKDMALQVLPYLISVSKKKLKINQTTYILTATSGDTGSAALCGFRKIEDIKTIVFYPNNLVSDIQEKQMLSYNGKNASALAFKGNFDDCQRLVKKLLQENYGSKTMFSSANSINIGRLIPQIVYYVYSYVQLVRSNKIQYKEFINICVPTGNFGNILAAYYAKKMGVFFNNFICASNKNDVLKEFFDTGIYDARREFINTNSPSMDILKSSNLERLLFDITNIDIVNELMNDLNKDHYYQLSSADFKKLHSFYGFSCDDEMTKETIQKVFAETKYLIDPHTAVAHNCYAQYINQTMDHTFTLIASTASCYKFCNTMLDALKIPCTNNLLENMQSLSKETKTTVPHQLIFLHHLDIKKMVVDEEEAINLVRSIIND